MTSKDTITRYTFGALTMGIRGLGVYLGGPKLEEKVAALQPTEIAAANQAAWKLRRQAERTMKRYSNVTIHGHGPYDAAHLDYMVAEAVCKATWRRMKSAA